MDGRLLVAGECCNQGFAAFFKVVFDGSQLREQRSLGGIDLPDDVVDAMTSARLSRNAPKRVRNGRVLFRDLLLI